LMVGCPARCKAMTDALLYQFGIYVQPINYPTVARGTERMRLTPSPVHSDEQMAELVRALDELHGANWMELGRGRLRELAVAK
jgi:5-aminolevulinate synthase